MTSSTIFQWSDLAKRSPEVGESLDQGNEVIVTRGHRQYVLAPLHSDVRQVIGDLCRLLSAVVESESPEHVSTILTAAWPWTRALPASDHVRLAEEVGPLAELSESVGTWKPLVDALAAWRGTARAWASGATPVGPFDSADELEVARP